MIEPIATTVAGDEPDTAAKSAHAITPASASPPCQWPTMAEANAIIRRATPPWVRKLPARMKNGIAMISKRSIPVKSFSATDVIGTVVIVNRNVSTVRPSAIETGMPVSIRPNRSRKMISGVGTCSPAANPSIGSATIASGSAANKPAGRFMAGLPGLTSAGWRLSRMPYGLTSIGVTVSRPSTWP